MTENNNRQIALDFATKNAGAGARPEQITAAAAQYLTFLDGQDTTAAAPAAPAPAPRTGLEIIDLITRKRTTYGAVVTTDLLDRADSIRTLPLQDAIRTALQYLTGSTAYPTAVLTDLTRELQLRYSPAPAATRRLAATSGQAIVDLIEGHRSEYGAYTDELLGAASRASFRTLPIADAKRTAVSTLRTAFEYRFPTQVANLIREINAL